MTREIMTRKLMTRKLKSMATRKYTGYDGDASGRRAGMEQFIKLTTQRFNGGVWNNGSWNVRNMNKSGKPRRSVHATGRAADLSWRRDAVWNGKKIKRSSQGFNDYQQAVQVVDFWIANADLFHALDRVKIANRLAQDLAGANRQLPVLLEVNVSI